MAAPGGVRVVTGVTALLSPENSGSTASRAAPSIGVFQSTLNSPGFSSLSSRYAGRISSAKAEAEQNRTASAANVASNQSETIGRMKSATFIESPCATSGCCPTVLFASAANPSSGPISGLTLSSTTTSYFFSRPRNTVGWPRADVRRASVRAPAVRPRKTRRSDRLRLRHAHQMQAETGCNRAMPCARPQRQKPRSRTGLRTAGDGLLSSSRSSASSRIGSPMLEPARPVDRAASAALASAATSRRVSGLKKT